MENECLYPKGHPYASMVIGSHEDLMAASLDDVKAFFRRYYTPNNLSLVVAGDIDPAQARALVEKYFGSIPPGPVLERVRRWVPQLSGEKIVEAKDTVPVPASFMRWPGPPYFDDDERPLNLTADILTDGLASRLQKALIYDRQLCTSVDASYQALEAAGAFSVNAIAAPGVALQDIEAVITARSPARGGRADTGRSSTGRRRSGRRASSMACSASADLAARPTSSNEYNTCLAPGHVRPGPRMSEGCDPGRCTASDIAMAEHPEPPHHPLLTGDLGAESQQQVDRATPPAMGQDKPFTAPQVQTAALENGLQVLVVPKPELPLVAATLVTRAGSIADPAGRRAPRR